LRFTVTFDSEIEAELWAMPVQPVSRSPPGLLVTVNVSVLPEHDSPLAVPAGVGVSPPLLDVAVVGVAATVFAGVAVCVPGVAVRAAVDVGCGVPLSFPLPLLSSPHPARPIAQTIARPIHADFHVMASPP
jgi:hypothetical protein